MKIPKAYHLSYCKTLLTLISQLFDHFKKKKKAREIYETCSQNSCPHCPMLTNNRGQPKSIYLDDLIKQINIQYAWHITCVKDSYELCSTDILQEKMNPN